MRIIIVFSPKPQILLTVCTRRKDNSGGTPSRSRGLGHSRGKMDSTVPENQSRTDELISALNLKRMNLESGLFAVSSVSNISVTAAGEPSPASNSIYFMLTRRYPQSYLHWLYSDDIQILIEGGPADYYLFFENGDAEKITMGRDSAGGQRLIVPCPGGTAKALVLHDSAEHLLIGSVVTPAWTPYRVRYGACRNFIDKYVGKADWATPDFLKFLIGPNLDRIKGGDADDREISIDDAGQIIWQGMQLTDRQLREELARFAANGADIPVRIVASAGAPRDILDHVKQLATAAGLAHQLK